MKEAQDMERIVQALEAQPHVDVPADFAQRVASRLPEPDRKRFRVPARLHAEPRYGQKTVLVVMVALLLAMMLMARSSQDSGLWLALQAALFLQFCGLVLWSAWALRRT